MHTIVMSFNDAVTRIVNEMITLKTFASVKCWKFWRMVIESLVITPWKETFPISITYWWNDLFFEDLKCYFFSEIRYLTVRLPSLVLFRRKCLIISSTRRTCCAVSSSSNTSNFRTCLLPSANHMCIPHCCLMSFSSLIPVNNLISIVSMFVNWNFTLDYIAKRIPNRSTRFISVVSEFIHFPCNQPKILYCWKSFNKVIIQTLISSSQGIPNASKLWIFLANLYGIPGLLSPENVTFNQFCYSPFGLRLPSTFPRFKLNPSLLGGCRLSYWVSPTNHFSI